MDAPLLPVQPHIDDGARLEVDQRPTLDAFVAVIMTVTAIRLLLQ